MFRNSIFGVIKFIECLAKYIYRMYTLSCRYVRVDSLVERIQELGVESEHNSSLEEALAEVGD